MRRLIISRDAFDTRVALLEDGRAAELYVERPGCLSRVGNIYKGRVENVLAGMDAAFVDIGIGRNGFLYVDEVAGAKGRSGRRITSLLRKGGEVLVQVTRDAMGGKGPRLTTQLSIAGRYIVYLPRTASTGASRRLEDAERERLRSICRGLDLGSDGMIARTAAEGADEQAIGRDLRFLRRVWAAVEQRAAVWSAPALVYADADLALRAVRDLLGPEFGDVVVDDPEVHRKLVKFVRLMDPELVSRVELHRGEAPLFEQYGLEADLKKALKRRVELPSGGYIVIDHTEAMTVIDVNTGSFVGRRFLEDTTFKTNIEACREVVRQLRLRDIGGIIVIDFIDMTVPSNREAVLAALQAELAKDRTKSYVVEISPLGLVEMTRQNVTPGLREVLTAPCPECGGGGRVMSSDTALAEVARRLCRLAAASSLPVVRVEVHPSIAAGLTEEPAAVATGAGAGADPGEAGAGAETGAVPSAGSLSVLAVLEAATGRRVVLECAGAEVTLDHLTVVPD